MDKGEGCGHNVWMFRCLREEVEVLEAGAGDEVLDAADVDLDAVDLAQCIR